ncbi:thiol reductase thioredoxin [bacterium]|nr:thiol reductase thioredoxin [bacterium]
MAVFHTDDINFEMDVLHSELPILVDFYADWCEPCQAMSLLIEEISGEYEGAVKFASIDIEESPNCTKSFSVKGVPNLLFFNKGLLTGRSVGLIDKETLIGFLDNQLKPQIY